MANQKIRITASRISRLNFDPNKPTKQIIFDSQLAGFGVRIYPSGRKVYVLQYGSSARRRLMVIAPCTTGKDVDVVREKAQELLRKKHSDGIDPLSENKRITTSTVAAIVQSFIDSKAPTWASREKASCESRLKNHIGPHIGNISLKKLTRAEVVNMHASVTKTTIYEANRSLQMLRAAINWAITSQGWRVSELVEGENPATRIKLNPEKRRKEWVRPKELPALVRAIKQEKNPWFRAFFLMTLATGARKGELLNLKWKDVDLKNRVILFRDTKNKEDHEIPLAADTVKLLRELPRTLKNPYVFCGHVSGKPINNPYRPWTRILKRSGIARRVTIHDLRRTVGSLLASSGFTTQQIGKLLNHKSEITAKVYAEIADEAKSDMVGAMAEMIK